MIWIELILLMLLAVGTIWNYKQIEAMKSREQEPQQDYVTIADYNKLVDAIDETREKMFQLDKSDRYEYVKQMHEDILLAWGSIRMRLNTAMNEAGRANARLDKIAPEPRKPIDAKENIIRNGKLADETFKESMNTYAEALQKQEMKKVKFPEEPKEEGKLYDKYKKKLEEWAVTGAITAPKMKEPEFYEAVEDIGDDTEELVDFFNRKSAE